MNDPIVVTAVNTGKFWVKHEGVWRAVKNMYVFTEDNVCKKVRYMWIKDYMLEPWEDAKWRSIYFGNPTLMIDVISDMYDLNLYEVAVDSPFEATDPINFEVKVRAGVSLYSRSVNNGAIYNSSRPADGSKLLVENYGDIYGCNGKGGKGGNGCVSVGGPYYDPGVGAAGGNGGPAVTVDMPITFKNYGRAFGGGGGGGGGGGTSLYDCRGGGAGGGGGGGNPGGGIGYTTSTHSTPAVSGESAYYSPPEDPTKGGTGGHRHSPNYGKDAYGGAGGDCEAGKNGANGANGYGSGDHGAGGIGGAPGVVISDKGYSIDVDNEGTMLP